MSSKGRRRCGPVTWHLRLPNATVLPKRHVSELDWRRMRVRESD